jgi:hypothetical protein
MNTEENMRSHEPPSPQELHRIETRLLKRITAANDDYQAARAKASRLQEINVDVDLHNADGARALREASRMESAAMYRYIEALDRYKYFLSNFILLANRTL